MRNRILAGGLVLHVVAPLAAALTLNNNFQLLPVPASAPCALAYSTTIPKCVIADFQPPNTCSDACVAGLQSIAAGVKADCAGLQAGESTLIYKVLNDQIIQSVCPLNTVKPSSSSMPKKSSTPTPSTTATSQTSTSQASSQALSSAAPSSSISAASTLSSAPAAATTLGSQSASQQQTSTTTSTTSDPAKPTLPDPNGSRVGLSMKQQQLAAARGSKGGSPFDVVGYDKEAGASKQQVAGTGWASIALFWTVMLLGR